MYAWSILYSSGGDTMFIYQESQYNLEKPSDTDIVSSSLLYIPTNNPIIDRYLRDNGDGTYTWVFIDIYGNEYDGQDADFVGITASYDELTGYLTITRGGAIPIVIERWQDDGFYTLASFAADTTDISFFLPSGGKYRIRRDWSGVLECSNTIELEIMKIGKQNTDMGEKLLIERYGQLQVGKTPDDPDYNANYDRTYMIFGLVKLPFVVSGSAGATSLTVTPDTTDYNTPNLLAYLKFDSNNSNYLNLVKIKNDVYFAKPTGTNTLELSTGLKEDVSDERLYAVNQFKIFSDIYLASEENKIVFEDSQMTLEDWGGTVGFIRNISPDTFLTFLLETGEAYSDDVGLHINKVSGGVVAGRIKIGVDGSHDPYILFSKSGTSYCTIYFRYDGTVSYIEFPNGLKFAFGQTTSTSYPDGTLLVDSTTGDLKFKKGGTWYTVQLA